MSRNKTARQHNFAIIPSPQIPRSKHRMSQTRKMGFNASELIPIMCEEVLPGDTWQHTEHLFARLATPIAPLVDDLDLETWYFYVPNRIVDENWEDLITGKDTDLTVPSAYAETASANHELLPNSVLDHFGLLPQIYSAAAIFNFNVYPILGYFTIYNQWFRDQNLQAEYTWPTPWTSGSGATTAVTNGTAWDQMPLRVNKRHDYITSSLPWAQKGDAVTLSLGATAPVYNEEASGWTNFIQQDYTTPGAATATTLNVQTSDNHVVSNVAATVLNNQLRIPKASEIATQDTTLYADLSTATAITINALRLAAVTQKLLELDARGGSRYVENLLSHWKVRSPDYRLQIPEYLGGSRTPITVNPIAQTAAYDAEPDPATASNLGNLGAEMHASSSKRSFTYAAVEHGYIIGLCAVRSTPTYQQGTRKHWTRSARLDFWDPGGGR